VAHGSRWRGSWSYLPGSAFCGLVVTALEVGWSIDSGFNCGVFGYCYLAVGTAETQSEIGSHESYTSDPHTPDEGRNTDTKRLQHGVAGFIVISYSFRRLTCNIAE
jgi:hypothetical protein